MWSNNEEEGAKVETIVVDTWWARAIFIIVAFGIAWTVNWASAEHDKLGEPK